MAATSAKAIGVFIARLAITLVIISRHLTPFFALVIGKFIRVFQVVIKRILGLICVESLWRNMFCERSIGRFNETVRNVVLSFGSSRHDQMSVSSVWRVVYFGSDSSGAEIAIDEILANFVPCFCHTSATATCTFVIRRTADSFTLVSETIGGAGFAKVGVHRVRNIFAVWAKSFLNWSLWSDSLVMCLLFLWLLCMLVSFTIGLGTVWIFQFFLSLSWRSWLYRGRFALRNQKFGVMFVVKCLGFKDGLRGSLFWLFVNFPMVTSCEFRQILVRVSHK